MNFSFLDTFRLKGEKPKVFTPKMFPTKLNSRKGLFLNKYPTASIVHPEFKEKIFNYIGSWTGSKALAKLSSSFLLRIFNLRLSGDT